MSFERIDIKNNEIEEGRSCIFLCNFSGKELKMVENYAGVIGIKDRIVLSYKNGDSKIKDIVDGKILSKCTEGPNNRAIIFNNISQFKIGMFIENLKKIKVRNVLFAAVTETSKEWTLNNLIENLVEERKAMQSGTSIHDK